MALFERIEDFQGKKKSSAVAEKIMDCIRSGIIKQGDRLPPERTIAEELGVSRPPVREALSALQIMGVVTIATGDGTYVKRKPQNNLPNLRTVAMLEESESPFEVLRARRAIEMTIIQIAASEAGKEDLAALNSNLREMKHAADSKDFAAYFHANRNFHLSIARAAHNSVLVRIMEFLFEVENQPLWREVCQKHFSKYEHIKLFFSQHQKMIESIAAGDKARARRLAYNHFSRSVDEVSRYL
jgi:GntR family transcriptional repressor for pyruvate dehydrogenase complex